MVGSTNRSSLGRKRGSGGLRLAATLAVAVAGLLGVERPVASPFEDDGRDHEHAGHEQEQGGEQLPARSRERRDPDALTIRTTPMPPMRPRASVTPISRYSAGGAPGAGGGTVGGVADASGTRTTAVPYATISDIVPASSELSKRIEITALAPTSVAFWTILSIAWRRVSSSRLVYSWISPPTMERRPR